MYALRCSWCPNIFTIESTYRQRKDIAEHYQNAKPMLKRCVLGEKAIKTFFRFT